MKAIRIKSNESAFTMTELVFVVACIAVLFLLLLPSILRSTAKSSRVGCVNQLKQVGLSFRLFATDHQDKFPFYVSTNDGGSMEAIPYNINNQVQAAPLHYMHFLCLSNELGNPRSVQCPNDESVKPIISFSNFNNQVCSYFVGTSSDETRPDMILAGDKNMTNYQRPIGFTNASMFITITTNRNDGNPESTVAGFDRKLHAPSGNIALADGSVMQLSTPQLQELLRKSEHTQKFSFP
jgi:competence protein ComGC